MAPAAIIRSESLRAPLERNLIEARLRYCELDAVGRLF